MTGATKPKLEYIAAGGNPHPSAADWAPGLLAFGAGNNVALWNPDDEKHSGVYALLNGHTDLVNAIRIFQHDSVRFIVSGGSDNTVRIWRETKDALSPFEEVQCFSEHSSAVNALSALSENALFASGAADGAIKVWQLQASGVKLLQPISLQPRYLPLAIAIVQLETGDTVLAVAGTKTIIQLYAKTAASEVFELQASLSGHDGWIRSLDFIKPQGPTGDVLLASASQDKYVRLWRFRRGLEEHTSSEVAPSLEPVKKSLSNKTHEVGAKGQRYAVTFEALLVGHEDWIYSARWAPSSGADGSPTLLTASADNSLSMWSVEEASGFWVCNTRLGEISAQKGSTTATGSTGGFWVGLWQPDGRAVVSLGRTGSWRRWSHDGESNMWVQQLGISGHVQEVQGLEWAPDGSYLLSTGLDQTTRMVAPWNRDGVGSWHEMARPQIHGYDLNCISTLTPHQFVSGADEKLLRVFNKPKAIDELLTKLTGATSGASGPLPDTANIPVLGLSNKVATDDAPANDAEQPSSSTQKAMLDLDQPPFEDHLARHTLWPEHEKLYGHGYEISTVASNASGTLIATACKASSIDHAVIRLYETKDWREIKPPLSAHNLTVTSLDFSPDSRYLLSVGRDRQWALFANSDATEAQHKYKLLKSNPKGHSRMILDCAWSPDSTTFATAGRDKSIKIWSVPSTDSEVQLVKTMAAPAPVTAITFSPVAGCLAFGTEEGSVAIVRSSARSWEDASVETVDRPICPSKVVSSLSWRPNGTDVEDVGLLAVGSEDCSLRLFRIAVPNRR